MAREEKQKPVWDSPIRGYFGNIKLLFESSGGTLGVKENWK